MVETEKQRMLYECGDLTLNEIKKEVKDKEDEIKKLENELEKTIYNGQRTQGEIDKMQRNLEKLKEKTGVSCTYNAYN